MTKHTELPWEVDKENVHAGQICSCHGDADTWYEVWTPNWQNGIDQQANAEFIVKACNNHYRQQETSKWLLKTLEMLIGQIPLESPHKWSEAQKKDLLTAIEMAQDCMEEADEAIKAAS